MDAQDFDELAGRIDGIGQALLRVVSALEMQGFMDGPQVAAEWRAARPAQLATGTDLQASHKVLRQLADRLDKARKARAEYFSDRPELTG